MIETVRSLFERAATLLRGSQPASVAAPAVVANVSAKATTTTIGPRRRRPPWEPTSWIGKVVCWLLAPILDPHDNYPSGPRCMAWFIALTALKHEIGAALASMLLATMWGYSAWKANQEKTTATLSAVQNITASYTHAYTENVQRVVDGRMPEHGFDPSKPVADPSGGAE